MTDPRDFEWLRELCCPERDSVDDWSALSAEDRARLERLDAEVFALVARTLDPVEPTGVCKETLMRRCVGQVPAARLVATAPRRPRSQRWLLPVAAGIAALGIGYALSMVGTVRRQQEELGRLRADEQRLVEVESELAATRDAMQLVSSRGVAICPLRPVGAADDASANGQGPYGLLFLAADHQHWYVRVAGLDAAPDRYYRVWFETDDGMVPAGNLVGSELELGSPSMPEGTRAFLVSLEDEPEPGAPSDEIVLYGNDLVTVL